MIQTRDTRNEAGILTNLIFIVSDSYPYYYTLASRHPVHPQQPNLFAMITSPQLEESGSWPQQVWPLGGCAMQRSWGTCSQYQTSSTRHQRQGWPCSRG